MALLGPQRTAPLLLAAAAIAIGCGSAASPPGGKGEGFAGVRAAVVHGAARDFAVGTGVGGPRYEACVLGRLRAALDRPTLVRLVQVYRRPGGQQFAAQALNDLALPLGARCGHRFYVPELVEASRGLAKGRLAGAAVRQLGVAYGPFLGVRCRRANRIGCDRVGIDVVLRRPASRVVAAVGARRLPLRTPGMHSGVVRHDWVGTFSHAGIGRPGSPFQPADGRRVRAFWAGYPPIYVTVGLRVRYADGQRAAAVFPRVFLSSGWG